MDTSIKELLNNGTAVELRALFAFTIEEDTERIIVKFNLWARKYYPEYFDSLDAPFHEEIDRNMVELYKGNII